MRRIELIAGVILIAALPTKAQMQIPWFSIDGGGGSSAGASFTLSGTVGQPDAQPTPQMSGGSFEITGGYWAAANVCYCPGDMNGDGHRDGRDIQQFVACLLVGGDCSCADVDAANGVTIADMTSFVSASLNTSACP